MEPDVGAECADVANGKAYRGEMPLSSSAITGTAGRTVRLERPLRAFLGSVDGTSGPISRNRK